jgi:hypothetical protein
MESRRKNNDGHTQMRSLAVPKVRFRGVCERANLLRQVRMHMIRLSLLVERQGDLLEQLVRVSVDLVERAVYVNFPKLSIEGEQKYLGSHQNPECHQLPEALSPTLDRSALPYSPLLQLLGFFRGPLAN